MEIFVIILIVAIIFMVDFVTYKITGEHLQFYKNTSQPDPEPVNNMSPYSRKSDENIQITYAYLAGWLIKKNARDSKKKVDFVRHYFQTHFSVVHISAMEKLIDAMRYETNIRSVAKWIQRQLGSGEERIAVIDFLFEIVKADGEIIDREFVAIVRFAELIGVKASYIDKKMQEFQQEKFNRHKYTTTSTSESKRTKHLLTLHLTEGFTQEQLKRAYRKLVIRYHPDKQMNASPQEISLAKQKFIEVQEAYDYLSK